MTPFTSLTSVAAPLPEGDVDTDIIFPARFLLLLDKAGLAKHLFHERRRRNGQPKFVLDTPPFDRAKILVAGENFGCGSSREQAVWALADFGIRCHLGAELRRDLLHQLSQERRPADRDGQARARTRDEGRVCATAV